MGKKDEGGLENAKRDEEGVLIGWRGGWVGGLVC